ncbi:MAG: DUF3822 family protein [Bacteroidia bacterium]
MELTSAKFQVKHSVIDESFDPDKTKRYRLFIQLGNDFLAACILDDSRKKFICLEDFRFHFSDNAEILAEKFELVKQQSKFLLFEDFLSVNCCVNFPKSTLVPEPLYDKNSETLFLDFNFGENKEELILTDDLKLIYAKNLFALPHLLQKMLLYWFPHVSIHHMSTAFINSLIISNRSREEKTVSVNVRSEVFDLAITYGSKLLFYNTFHYKTSEDFLYFILFTLEQLQLNPEKVFVKLSGEIETHNNLHESVLKYLQNVSFSEYLNAYKFSYRFEQLPPAAYYTLFNQHLCES